LKFTISGRTGESTQFGWIKVSLLSKLFNQNHVKESQWTGKQTGSGAEWFAQSGEGQEQTAGSFKYEINDLVYILRF